ncbi:MAG TPA: hypothetical protein VMB85_03480 [Bryobacteraceae bacterium]|nr:hypothetical protein [Bryobacteraceae bacterium]
MAADAPAIARLIALLIPPASREEVLGDLRERCGARFAGEALRVLPFLLLSRIRRTTDAVVFSMQALSLLASFVLAAAWLDGPLLAEQWGFARIEIPVAVVLATLVLADAYADPKKRPLLRPMLAPVLGMALAFLRPALPWPVMLWGGMLGTGLITTLRLLIPPLADRRQAAKIPAYWQKLELDARNLAASRILLPFAAAVFLLIALSRWLRSG